MLEGFIKKKIKSFHYVIINCFKNVYREEVPQRNTKFKVFFVLDLTCSVTCRVTDMTSDLKKQQKFRHWVNHPLPIFFPFSLATNIFLQATLLIDFKLPNNNFY